MAAVTPSHQHLLRACTACRALSVADARQWRSQGTWASRWECLVHAWHPGTVQRRVRRSRTAFQERVVTIAQRSDALGHDGELRRKRLQPRRHLHWHAAHVVLLAAPLRHGVCRAACGVGGASNPAARRCGNWSAKPPVHALPSRDTQDSGVQTLQSPKGTLQASSVGGGHAVPCCESGCIVGEGWPLRLATPAQAAC